MCFPFGKETGVDLLDSKIGSVLHMNLLALEDEILSLQADIEVKVRASAGQFWNLLTEERYPNIRKCATPLTELFVLAYLCESEFSHMKIIKCEYRYTLIDIPSEACLRLPTSSYCPSYANLVDSIQCKSSE